MAGTARYAARNGKPPCAAMSGASGYAEDTAVGLSKLASLNSRVLGFAGTAQASNSRIQPCDLQTQTTQRPQSGEHVAIHPRRQAGFSSPPSRSLPSRSARSSSGISLRAPTPCLRRLDPRRSAIFLNNGQNSGSWGFSDDQTERDQALNRVTAADWHI